jgi:hypothetical protein
MRLKINRKITNDLSLKLLEFYSKNITPYNYGNTIHLKANCHLALSHKLYDKHRPNIYHKLLSHHLNLSNHSDSKSSPTLHHLWAHTQIAFA